jgi:hypothetical protein
MKNSVFKKFLFGAIFVLGVCVMCVSAVDSDISAAGKYCIPAMAAVAIPVCNLENLKAVTQAEFSALQAKYGKLYVIDVLIDDDETYQFILRRPTRQHMEMMESYKNDTGKINDLVIKNLVIAGDMEALDDGIVYARLMAETGKIVTQASAFLYRA